MKIVARTMGKQLLAGLKAHTYKYLCDVPYFYNKNEELLRSDVMEWLLDQAEGFVEQEASVFKYPGSFINASITETAAEHKKNVHEQKEKVKARIHAEKMAEINRMNAKEERRVARIARKKLEAKERLRLQIERDFVKTGVTVEPILNAEIADVDGHCISDKK